MLIVGQVQKPIGDCPWPRPFYARPQGAGVSLNTYYVATKRTRRWRRSAAARSSSRASGAARSRVDAQGAQEVCRTLAKAAQK